MMVVDRNMCTTLFRGYSEGHHPSAVVLTVTQVIILSGCSVVGHKAKGELVEYQLQVKENSSKAASLSGQICTASSISVNDKRY
jgi:hypothetical protein